MGQRVLKVTAETFRRAFGLPPDAVVTGFSPHVFFDADTYAFRVESEYYGPTPEGHAVPVVEPPPVAADFRRVGDTSPEEFRRRLGGRAASLSFAELHEAVTAARGQCRGPGRVGFDALAEYDACVHEWDERAVIDLLAPPRVRCVRCGHTEQALKCDSRRVPAPPDDSDPDDGPDDADDTPIVVTDPE